MSGKKAGSDGQIRKTTAEWAVDTKTYLEGMRLMDTDTGVVRVSKGTTYADAWTPSSGPGSVTSNDVGDDSNYNTASVTAALDQAKTDIEAVDSARIAFEDTVNDQLAAIDVHIDQVETDLEQAIADEAAARTAGDATEVDNNLDPSTTRAPSKTAVNTALADKATVRVNGALKKGLFTYSGTTNGSGQLTVDLTAQTPAITEATWLGIGSRLDTDLAHAALADGSLAGYAVQFYDNTGGPLGDSVSVTFTIAGQTD